MLISYFQKARSFIKEASGQKTEKPGDLAYTHTDSLKGGAQPYGSLGIE